MASRSFETYLFRLWFWFRPKSSKDALIWLNNESLVLISRQFASFFLSNFYLHALWLLSLSKTVGPFGLIWQSGRMVEEGNDVNRTKPELSERTAKPIIKIIVHTMIIVLCCVVPSAGSEEKPNQIFWMFRNGFLCTFVLPHQLRACTFVLHQLVARSEEKPNQIFWMFRNGFLCTFVLPHQQGARKSQTKSS